MQTNNNSEQSKEDIVGFLTQLKKWLMGKKSGNVLFYGTLIVLTIIKLCTSIGLVPYGISDSAYDDMLFVRQAQSIASGNWLGEFNKVTLLKRPMYAIFQAVVSKLNISYQLAVQIVYLLAVVLFVYAMSRVIKSRMALLVMYLGLLYSPAMYNFDYVQRVYRMGLVPTVTLLVLAGFIQLFYLVHQEDTSQNKKQLIIWSVYTGLVLVVFWNLREDSIWIMPFCITATIISAVVVFCKYNFIKDKSVAIKKKFALTACWLIVPFVLMYIGNSGIKMMNYIYYGVYTDSEMNSSELGKMMSTMYSVKSDEDYEYVNLDKNTFYRILEVSPTMQSLQPHMDNIWESGWVMDNGQIAGGYIVYAFRDALNKAGYYEDNAVAKEQICKQINQEVQAAIDAGKLEAEKGIFSVSFLMGKRGANLKLFMAKYAESLKWISTYEKMNVQIRKSEKNPERLRQIEAVTNDLLVYPDEITLVLKGYCLPKDEDAQIRMFLTNEKETTLLEIPSSIPSEDVYNFYRDNGMESLRAINCRFSCETEKYDSSAILQIAVNGEVQQKISLENLEQMHFDNDMYILNFDVAEEKVTEDSLYNSGWGNLKICNAFITIYKKTAVPMMVLSVIALVMILVKAFDKKQEKESKAVMLKSALVLLGIGLSGLLLAGGVTYRYADAPNSEGRNLYLAGVYPLYHIVTIGSIILAYYFVIRPKLENKRNEKRG